MLKNRIASLILTTALVGAIFGTPPAAHAADPVDTSKGDTLIVSPPVTELNANPGQHLTYKVTITNATTRSRSFSTTVNNAVPKGNDGAPDLVPDDGPYALRSWVKLSPAKATIAAGGQSEFTVDIDVPKDAGPGSHSGGIVFTPGVDPAAGGAAVSVVAEVSSLLLVNVSGDVKNDTKLVSFKADKTTYQTGPATLTAVFKNDGNVVSRPQGTIKVKNAFGKTVSTLKIEPQRVLPTAERKFEVKLDKKALFGPYTATLEWHADTVSSEPAQIRFWGAPWKPLAAIGGGIVTFFLAFWIPRHRIKKALKVLLAGG